MKCIFYNVDTERPIGEKRIEPPPVAGDYLTDVPGEGTREWYVERRRHRLQRGEVELWISPVD